MKVIVLSQDEAVKMATSSSDKMAILSITNRLSKNVSFPSNDNIISIHNMKFDDEYLPKGNGPRQEYFEGLKEFVDDIYDKVDILIVHCAAGMSRSPAVAEAIAKYLEDVDVIYKESEYPNEKNILVYRFACNELGVEE